MVTVGKAREGKTVLSVSVDPKTVKKLERIARKGFRGNRSYAVEEMIEERFAEMFNK